jgi:hypothetical protein
MFIFAFFLNSERFWMILGGKPQTHWKYNNSGDFKEYVLLYLQNGANQPQIYPLQFLQKTIDIKTYRHLTKLLSFSFPLDPFRSTVLLLWFPTKLAKMVGEM